jgi:hypothetical protein
MPTGLSHNGDGAGRIPLVQGGIAVSGGACRTGHQRDQAGLVGRRNSAGSRRRRNFRIEIEAAKFLRANRFHFENEMEAGEFLRAFRFEHVPRGSPGNGNSTATGLSEGFMFISCLNARRYP